ncbi:MAG: MoxR-like ATPase [Myxococcota bacterium]|jgi:MoxR-like ATPase
MSASVEERVVRFKTDYHRLRDEIAKVIVGQEDIVEGVVIGLIAGGHILLEGVPGLGKTRLVRALADAMHLKFSRIQFTPDLQPGDVTGSTIAVTNEQGRLVFEFQPGPIFANIVLADEVNRAGPRTQAAMLEAMQERSVTVGKTTHQLARPFFVLATQNPLEMEGTYPLPEAQLDRFLLKLQVQFPDRESMHAILDRTTHYDQPEIQPVVTAEQIESMRHLSLDVPCERHVQDYAIRVVQATHPEMKDAPGVTKQYVRYGSSPRGAQALILAAKVKAVMDGRFNVAVDDIRHVLKPALRHRIILNFEGEAEGVSTDQVLEDILKAVKK